MATWLDDVTHGLESIGGIGSLSQIYEAIRLIRPLPHPQSFTAIIRRTLESHSSDSEAFNNKKDLFYSVDGIGSGVWGLRSYLADTPKAIDIEFDLPTGNLEPQRAASTTYRILRDTLLARKIKELYVHKCQICGLRIKLNNEKYYSEAHHIIPLGKQHKGSDTSENIIVLCPNHHVMMDYGLLKIEIDKLYVHPKHKLSEKSIEYHNLNIYFSK